MEMLQQININIYNLLIYYKVNFFMKKMEVEKNLKKWKIKLE